MKSLVMKSLLLTAFTCASVTVSFAGSAGYWVVGNQATNKCEIVTSNPTIDGNTIQFESGPYQSLDDAKLARSTIRECPKESPPSNGNRTPSKQ